MLKNKLSQYTQSLEEKGLRRFRKPFSLTSNGLSFSSNDYLSLSHHAPIKRAYRTGFLRYPTGSGGSMVVCGYHPIHQSLERAFSNALGVDDALLFSSGYAANLSVLRLLKAVDIEVLIDKSVHASIYDGLQGADVAYRRYLSHDLSDLKLKAKEAHSESIIFTESIFSMSGHITPLAQIAKLHKPLIVDEAHGFGILGNEGLGGVNAAKLTQEEVPLRIIPFGKTLAAQGAIVAGDAVWIDALLQAARPYIYSTAISPAMTYGLLKTLEVIQNADERRQHLTNLVRYFCQAIQHSDLKWRDSSSPIQQLQLGCPYLATAMALHLQQQGIICLPMRQPTVSKQESGLRIILNYDHTKDAIDYLLKCIHAYSFS